MRAAGRYLRDIATAIGVPKSTLHRALGREFDDAGDVLAWARVRFK